MTTNTNTNTTPVSSEVQEKLDYNEYQLECASDDIKPKTFHQWKNQSKLVTPGLFAKATGTVAPAKTNNGAVPKSLIARQVFARHAATGVLVRKNIILEFVSEALLTPAGAATYYANIGLQYRQNPVTFMDANYVAPVVDEDAELEQIEEEVASLLATDAVALTVEQISLAAESELDAAALEDELADEFDVLAANDEAEDEEDAA